MAAAALLRSVARRSTTTMLPRAAARALSPRQLLHGGLCRRPDLLTPAVTTPARLFSSATPGSPNENPLPPGDGNKKVSAFSRDKELPTMRELERKIVEKQGELLRLLQQWDVARRPSSSDSDERVQENKEQPRHPGRELQGNRQRKKEAHDDPLANFVLFILIVVILRHIFF